LRGRRSKQRALDVRLISITSLSGVRGAITLAAVMSIPLAMPNGSAFPARDLLIFLATGVILCSLLSGSFFLPWLLKGLQLDGEHQRQRAEEMRARHGCRKPPCAA